MGIRGLFSYIRRNGGADFETTFTLEEILDEIRSLEKPPKIIINCRAFFGYFSRNHINAIFGGRNNLIVKEFEEFLKCLTDAGAELIFVFKKRNADRDGIFEGWVQRRNLEYQTALEYVKNLAKICMTRDMFDFLQTHYDQALNYDHEMNSVLYYSALKYGTFRGDELGSYIRTSAHNMKIADEVGAYAIIGLNTSYLFYEGDQKLWFPEEKETLTNEKIKFNIKQHDRKAILRALQMTLDQFQVLEVLAGKHIQRHCTENIFSGGFPRDRVQRIRNFVLDEVEMPMTRRSIESMVEKVIGKIDLDVVDVIVKELATFSYLKESSKPNARPNENKFNDEEVKSLIVDDPFTMAEEVLNERVIAIDSPILDVSAKDMKPLKDLTLPWIKRTMGLLLEHIKGSRSREIMFRVNEVDWEVIEVEAESPNFEVPVLRDLVSGSMSIDQKLEILAFITGNIIAIEQLHKIPFDYLMHIITVTHLVHHDSLEPFEAVAFTKALKDFKDDQIPAVLLYPEVVNIRAFRTSFLYSKIFYTLTRCMSSLGLQKLMTGNIMDNVQYQIYYQKLMYTGDSNEKLFDKLMNIVNP